MEAQTTPTSLPPRRVIASYTRYEEAQRAVDYLSDEKFPVERVAIIGEGLQLVEQVTGRLTWGKAALNGVLGGGHHRPVSGMVAGFVRHHRSAGIVYCAGFVGSGFWRLHRRYHRGDRLCGDRRTPRFYVSWDDASPAV